MINDYLNQTVTLEKTTGFNSYSEPTYSAGTSVRSRLDPCSKILVAEGNNQMTVTGKCYLLDAVVVNDKINGRKVAQVDTIYKLDGTFSHYEAYLK